MGRGDVKEEEEAEEVSQESFERLFDSKVGGVSE